MENRLDRYADELIEILVYISATVCQQVKESATCHTLPQLPAIVQRSATETPQPTRSSHWNLTKSGQVKSTAQRHLLAGRIFRGMVINSRSKVLAFISSGWDEKKPFCMTQNVITREISFLGDENLTSLTRRIVQQPRNITKNKWRRHHYVAASLLVAATYHPLALDSNFLVHQSPPIGFTPNSHI